MPRSRVEERERLWAYADGLLHENERVVLPALHETLHRCERALMGVEEDECPAST